MAQTKEGLMQEYKRLIGRYSVLIEKIPKLREKLRAKDEHIVAYRVSANVEISCISITDRLKKEYSTLKIPVIGDIVYWAGFHDIDNYSRNLIGNLEENIKDIEGKV